MHNDSDQLPQIIMILLLVSLVYFKTFPMVGIQFFKLYKSQMALQ